jgi:putative nucleotidyltransferase with HDIG domain
MKILNSSKAKKIALDVSTKINPVDRREFLLIHSKKVGKVAKMIAQKLQINDEVFEIAGWVHDIGYSKNFENHADFAIPILNELGFEVDEVLEDCILNHGNGKNPKTIEGKIFQVADKLSIFDQEIIESMFKHGPFPPTDDNINFLKMMSKKSFELLHNFEYKL